MFFLIVVHLDQHVELLHLAYTSFAPFTTTSIIWCFDCGQIMSLAPVALLLDWDLVPAAAFGFGLNRSEAYQTNFLLFPVDAAIIYLEDWTYSLTQHI